MEGKVMNDDHLYSEKKMRVVVEILTGTLFNVQLSDNATVADLKRKIGDQENLPYDQLVLILDRDLANLMNDDDISLVDYGIRDGSHVYLIVVPLVDGSTNDSVLTSLIDEHNWSQINIPKASWFGN